MASRTWFGGPFVVRKGVSYSERDKLKGAAMPETIIPDIAFPSYDEYRMWERSVDSLGDLIDLVKENKNNVALCEELMGQIEVASSILKEAMFGVIDEYCNKDEVKAQQVLVYQTGADEFVSNIIIAADQSRQESRRSHPSNPDWRPA